MEPLSTTLLLLKSFPLPVKSEQLMFVLSKSTLLDQPTLLIEVGGVVDLLKMLKAMRMDLTFDHEGMDKPLYM